MQSETVVYVRSPFPLTVDRLVNATFVEDAKLILGLPIEQLEAIGGALREFPGFLDQRSLHELINSIIRNDEHAKSLSRVIFILSELLRFSANGRKVLSDQLDEWQKGDENQKMLSAEDFAALQQRLFMFFRTYAGIERQAKARRLVEATGFKLKEIEIICDLRPVFDENRTMVEGIFPYTILKIVCDGVDGLPFSQEAILSEHNVAELAKKAEAAVAKLRSLKELLSAKQIPIPAVGTSNKGE